MGKVSRAEYGITKRTNDLKKLNNDYEGNVIVYKKDKSSGNINTSNTNNKNNTTNSTNNKTNNDLYLKINSLKIESFIQIDLFDSITNIRSAILYLHRIDDIKILDNCNITIKIKIK